MFCSQCRSEIPSDSRFCPSCGAQVPEPSGSLRDSELEALAAKGDREAFAELYERHFDRVYDLVLRMVRDRDEAADLTQETFLRAMRALSPKEKKAAFSTWLFTIARNLALKRLERQRRIAATTEQDDEEAEPAIYRQVDPDRFGDPQEAMQAHELSGLVWRAAAGLNAKELSLLDLHVRQGLESSEIAEVLGVSKGSAYTMMSRLKDNFESAVAALQFLQRGRQECQELNRLLDERRITFISPDARRLIDRHLAVCSTCQEQRRRLVSATAIFGSFAAVPVPLGLKPRIAEAVLGSWSEMGSKAASGLNGVVSQAASRVATLPPAWKAAILTGLLMLAVGGGLGGWVGSGGELPVFGGDGEGDQRAAVLPAVKTPEPTPTAAPSPTPAAPEGELIELVAFIGTDGNVWTISPDGSNPRQVTTNGDNAQPAWSPDGSTLLYIHSRHGVYLVNADGSGERLVPLRDDCADLVAQSQIGGLEPARLTRIQFTPDGQGIRLGIDWGGVTNQFICHLIVEGSAPPLPTVNGDEFSVNPKDGSIIFTQSGQGCAGMSIVDANGGNQRQVGPTMGVGCTFEPEELSVLPYASTWSPDGAGIAFYGVDATRTGRVYTLDTSDTTQPQPIADAAQVGDLQGGDLGLAWSPDGRSLAYEKDGSVWVLDIATGATRKLVEGRNPTWGRVPSDLFPTPTPTRVLTPTSTSTHTPTPPPAPCPVDDTSFCNFVYEIDTALATPNVSAILARTEFGQHTCGEFPPPPRGFPIPTGCEAQPADQQIQCIPWFLLGGTASNTCLNQEEYSQALSKPPPEVSPPYRVTGIDFFANDRTGQLYLRDPTQPVDPLLTFGLRLDVVGRNDGWMVASGGQGNIFYSQPEFSWPPE